MLIYILNSVAPVFLILLVGYLCVRSEMLSSTMIDGLMIYVTRIAVPCLLFRATSTVDLASAYHWAGLLSFYLAATLSFALAIAVSFKMFKRRPGESVAIGFSALFSNTVFLGLPITERALGEQYLPTAVAIVSIHAPFCYLLGISCMEAARADGRGFLPTVSVVVATIFKNNMMVAIGLGFIFNVLDISLPQSVTASLDLFQRSALPVALFGLGGVLARYGLSGDLRESFSISLVSLIAHPLLALILCTLLGVDEAVRNVIVLVASVSPGINAFVFANMYSRGESVAATTVLLSTMLSVISISAWLYILVGHL